MAKRYSTYTGEELEDAISESRETALYWQDMYIQAVADGFRGKNYNRRSYFDKTKRTKWKRFYRLRDEKCFRLLHGAGCICDPPKLPTRYSPPNTIVCLKCGKRATWRSLT